MKVEKPWGYEIRWAINEKYLGKILHIDAGKRLSLQYHEQKDETIYVSEGTLSLELGEGDKVTELQLNEGHAFHIEPGVIHRFCAPYGCVKLLEVSTPELDDIVRLEDNYGRVK